MTKSQDVADQRKQDDYYDENVVYYLTMQKAEASKSLEDLKEELEQANPGITSDIEEDLPIHTDEKENIELNKAFETDQPPDFASHSYKQAYCKLSETGKRYAKALFEQKLRASQTYSKKSSWIDKAVAAFATLDTTATPIPAPAQTLTPDLKNPPTALTQPDVAPIFEAKDLTPKPQGKEPGFWISQNTDGTRVLHERFKPRTGDAKEKVHIDIAIPIGIDTAQLPALVADITTASTSIKYEKPDNRSFTATYDNDHRSKKVTFTAEELGLTDAHLTASAMSGNQIKHLPDEDKKKEANKLRGETRGKIHAAIIKKIIVEEFPVNIKPSSPQEIQPESIFTGYPTNTLTEEEAAEAKILFEKATKSSEAKIFRGANEDKSLTDAERERLEHLYKKSLDITTYTTEQGYLTIAELAHAQSLYLRSTVFPGITDSERYWLEHYYEKAEQKPTPETTKTTRPRIASGVASEKKESHTKNQDTVLNDATNNFYGVFDGMGGHAGGDEASQLAQLMAHEYLKAHREAGEEFTLETLGDALATSHKAIKKKNNQNNSSGRTAMGTTGSLVAIIEHEGQLGALIANTGDSRVYHQPANKPLKALTLDDNILSSESPEKRRLVQNFLSNYQGGTIPSELKDSVGKLRGQQHIITRALGLDQPFSVILRGEELAQGDILAITSDGIHDNLTDTEINQIIGESRDKTENEIARLLITAATKVAESGTPRAKKDDMSAVIIKVKKDKKEIAPTQKQQIPEQTKREKIKEAEKHITQLFYQDLRNNPEYNEKTVTEILNIARTAAKKYIKNKLGT